EDRFAHECIGIFTHLSNDWESSWRWRSNRRDVSQFVQTEIECARNRCRCKREDIHVGTELLETLLLLHTKALFFVDDDQTKIVELHVVLQKAVGTNHNIHISFAEPFQRFLLLLC